MLSQGEGCREDVAGGVERYYNSPTSIYTTWARVLSDRNVFFTLRGGGKTAVSNAPGAFYTAVRTGSSNTVFFRSYFLFGPVFFTVDSPKLS